MLHAGKGRSIVNRKPQGLSGGTPTPTPAPVLSGTFPAAFQNTAYSAPLTITGGTAPYNYTIVSGALPTGLSLAVVGSTLVLSGTPTTGGSYTFAVKVTDILLADSNTVTTTGMVVNVFSASTFSTKIGRRNQARTGSILGSYLGDPTAYGTDLTIVSGNSTGHWQVQSRTLVVPPSSTTSIALVQQEGGLAPRGNGSGGNNWLTSAWPGTSGGALQNSYSVVVQHTATGQQCTINIDCDAATTKTWNDRTYNLGNAYCVSSDWEARNFGTTGPTNFLTRNANEGGWVIVRDGVYLGGSDRVYAFYWFGTGTFAGGSVAFTRGTWSASSPIDGASVFQATHGDRASGRIVEGWTGGNYTLIAPETPFGAKISNYSNNFSGLIFAQFEILTSGTSGSRFGLQARSNDCVVDCCDFHCDPAPTAGNKYGFFGSNVNPYPRYQTALNSKFWNLDEGFHSFLIEPYVAGCLFETIRADCGNAGVNPLLASFPAGGTCNGYVGWNIAINNDISVGAHPDVFQYYVLDPTSIGTGVLPGTIVMEKNMNLTTSQFMYNGGSDATAAKIATIDHNNMSIVGKYVHQHSCVLQNDRLDYCNTSLYDLNGADFDAANPPGHSFGSNNVNVTNRDNAAERFDVPNASGTVVYDQTGANTSSGFNAKLTVSNAAYAGYFATSFAAGSGGIVPYTINIHDWQSAWNAGLPYFVPNNALAGAGGLKRADGTGPGALKPGSTPSAPIWNDGATAW